MELEEAIEILKEDLEHTKKANECGLATKGEFNKEIEAIEFILTHITKQEKMIELMIEELVEQFNHYEPCYLSVETDGIICDEQESCKQCIKQYFEKKAEESKQMINNIKDIEQICKQIDELSFEELQNAMEKADAELQKEEGE